MDWTLFDSPSLMNVRSKQTPLPTPSSSLPFAAPPLTYPPIPLLLVLPFDLLASLKLLLKHQDKASALTLALPEDAQP